MKYQVQIKYTNPAHEHVSLRRRVESVTRLVEASNEQEALNRASNQQRALGFMVQEVSVFDEAAKDWKKAFQKVAAKNLNKDLAAVRSNVHRLDKATKNHDDDVEDVKDKVRKGMKEEVEQIDELKKSTLASYVKGATRVVASASRLQRGYETDAIRSEFPPVQRGSELAAKTMRKLAGKRSRGIARAVDKLAKEEVEQVDEGIAADMFAAKREKKQKAVRDKILDQELQSRKVARGKARQAGTMGHPAKADRFEKIKNEEKANVAVPKKVSKINLALNKMKKKTVNMMPTIDAEKK
jgi:hypothetical protein